MSDMGVKYDLGPPPWSEAPEWANWLAMNPNGKWGWHNVKPVKGAQKWLWLPTDSRSPARGYVSDVHGRGWAETLEPRPTNTGDDWPGHTSPEAMSIEDEPPEIDAETLRMFHEGVKSGEVNVVADVPGYESLRRALDDAYEQAAYGKGAERHACDRAFEDQPMQQISNLLQSNDGMAYQAIKKIQEAQRMDKAAARRELLGAIVYLAGAIVWMDRQEED